MSDFQPFRNAVLENDDLQEQVISIVNTATANGSGLGDGITTLAKTHGYTITSDEVYAHQDFLGQDGDLTDFELEMISGGGLVAIVNPSFIPPIFEDTNIRCFKLRSGRWMGYIN